MKTCKCIVNDCNEIVEYDFELTYCCSGLMCGCGGYPNEYPDLMCDKHTKEFFKDAREATEEEIINFNKLGKNK